MTHLQSVFYTNGSKVRQTIIIEPWAEEFPIAPGQTYEIVVYVLDGQEVPADFGKDHAHCIEIQSSDSDIVFYGPVGCLVHVCQDGKPLEPSSER